MDFLSISFINRAFAAGVLTSILISTVGVFVVLRRMSMVGDSLSHASLAGVAFGMLFGIYPFYGALVFTVIAAILIEILRKAFKKYSEVALAVVMSAGIGLAVVMISLGKSFNRDLFSYLFGSLIAVSETDIKIMGFLGLAVITSIIALNRELFAVTFDEESAKISGIPVNLINLYLSLVTALSVALSVRIVGTLLVSALMVIPTAVSLQVSKSFKMVFIISNLVALFSVILGIIISYYFDLAPGGTIVLISSFILAIALLIKGVRSGWD
ncbi:metal ABC transporter permease [Thermovenabulum gondwanense]|uniref:High-affinity zinc uptake system membrane protein ZnuB n=1 Tax=Thermovenabulum gondwanense TaxID=520767 RepID=A0A162MTM8_9FIRM|nr:metal ABC transporter permease [Thermovenabulum gondwanense]KYO67307.1 High-affinity zinc uptake system membrane protein ZnuB [Thermovenabulum gondwanense]